MGSVTLHNSRNAVRIRSGPRLGVPIAAQRETAVVVRGSDTPSAPPSAPQIFAVSDWSIVDAGTGSDAIISILALPDNGGSALSLIQYRINNGAWQQLTAAPAIGDYLISDQFTDGVASNVAIRAVNAVQSGAASAAKSVITTAPAEPLAAPAFAVAPTDTLDGRTLTVTTGTVTGNPTPTLSITMTVDGSPVIPSGSGPWTYEVPSSLIGLPFARTVTATNSQGTATSSGSGTVPSDLGASIVIDDASYEDGGAGVGPLMNIAVTLTGTTGPYTVFGATHANGTTLSKADIENGTGDAVDIFDFSDADGLVSNQIETLATSLTDGHLSLFIKDDNGVESDDVFQIDGVNVDATAATLSSPVATQTGATTADWSITSNEASGVVYAGVRPTASAALTSAQLIAGSGGAGVAWSADTTMTADANNGGSFTGLTAETAYKVDYVAVDDWGNVGSVVSSAEFTTAAAPVLSFSYIDTATDLDAQTSYTFTDTELTSLDFTAGGKYLVVALSHESTNTPEYAAATGCTIGGVTAVAAEPVNGYPSPDPSISAAPTAWIATVPPAATEEITITADASSSWSGLAVAVYQIDGYTVRDVKANWTSTNPKSVSLSTALDAPVIVGVIFDDAPSVSSNLNVDATLGTVDASGNVATGEEWGTFSDADAAATETKVYAFSTANGNVRYAVTMIALEAA